MNPDLRALSLAGLQSSSVSDRRDLEQEFRGRLELAQRHSLRKSEEHSCLPAPDQATSALLQRGVVEAFGDD
jgi:hypothetical protein